MASRKTFMGNLFVVDHYMTRHGLSKGCFVECGTWRGGMAFALTELCQDIQEFHYFDSFEGLPPAGVLDGEDTQRDQAEDKLWHNNNSAEFDDFMTGLNSLNRPERPLSAHKGWFEDTLPGFTPDREISILRLDGDWYDSTMCILDNCYDKVVPGGVVLIDDYYDWDGCTRAVHDFLSARKSRDRIRQSRFGGVAYLLKEAPTD